MPVESEQAGAPPAYPIGSVDSALRLLIMVADRRQLRIADAAEELGVARSTAHRLMQMLQFHGFVRRDADSRTYSAGPVLFNMGLTVVRSLDIRSHARPAMEELSNELDETVRLLVTQQSRQLVCIDAVESERSVRVAGRIGLVVPAHSTAAGRAVLALLSSEELREIYPETRISDSGGALVGRRGLERELQATRVRGYAVQRGEVDEEVSAVAAPIRDPNGRASFVIAISVPSSRLTDALVPRLGNAAAVCADKIAAELPW